MVVMGTEREIPEYTTRLLTVETWDDFARLVEDNNGVWGGCWCMGFHPEGLSRTSRGANEEAKHEHVRKGTVHQVLVYEGDDNQGVAHAAVARALEEIRAAGGGLVESYPEQVEDRAPQRGSYFHTGPESLYAAFGFGPERKIAKWRWVMRKMVSP